MADKENRAAIYARVSTKDQHTDNQLRKLREWADRHEMKVIGEFQESASGRNVRRPEQEKVMSLVRGRHIHAVIVLKLDRWGRSLIDLRNTIQVMVDNGVKFIAVDSGITYEKNSPIGNLLLNQLAAIAEFEVDLISERTKDGLEATRARGTKLGRPLDPCFDCGAERDEPIRARRSGIRRPVCASCKKKG